jgi:hypothetical protein
MSPTRKGSPDRSTPLVQDGDLYLPSDEEPLCAVGSEVWRDWLDQRIPSSEHTQRQDEGEEFEYAPHRFYFDAGDGITMTCMMQERSDVNSPIWIGYSQLDGKTRSVYLGKTERLYKLSLLTEKANKLHSNQQTT